MTFNIQFNKKGINYTHVIYFIHWNVTIKSIDLEYKKKNWKR